MAGRTVSNLSRETNVSRPTIYKKIKELGLKSENRKFTESDYRVLQEALLPLSKSNDSKVELPTVEANVGTMLDEAEKSTARDRLRKAKEQYNFNDALIAKFQAEADRYIKEHHKSTLRTHNGTEAAIPAIASLEKYVKLNISLSKAISDLESVLDLSEDSGDDPFA